MRTCPICNHNIKPSQLMCAAHWAQVPQQLKSQVNAAYGEWLREVTLDAANELRAAQSKAVDAVKGTLFSDKVQP